MQGRKVKVFFDDGEKISWREGSITSEDQYSITLDHKQIIPRGRIVRMEVVESGSNY
jgi:sRNA-binding regulator protein Hfq